MVELYDPAYRRKRKSRRKNSMPRRRRRSYRRRTAPTRRRRVGRRSYSYDPAPRRRRRSIRSYFKPRRRRSTRRRYDPAFGRTGMFGSFLRPLSVMVGGFLHNMLISRGILAGTKSAMGASATDASLALGGLGVVAEGMGWRWGELLNHIGSGALAEGVSVPAIEGVAKGGVSAGGARAGLGDSYIPLGAYSTQI